MEQTAEMRKLRIVRLNRDQKDTIFSILCVLPAFLGLSIVVFLPIIKAIWMSFYNYKLIDPDRYWNNFENYIRLFSKGEVFIYFENTLFYIFFTVIIQFTIAIVMALMLDSSIRGKNLLRGFILIPWTIPSVVVALLWSWIFQPQYGVLNYVFYNLDWISDRNQLWTSSPKLAMVTVIAAAVWRQTPYMIVMLVAGLQSVSNELKEAARIDGATSFGVFRHVIIPSIRPVIDSAVMVAIITNSQMFAIIYNMTAGGPMNKTTTFSIAAYTKAFTEFDFGSGAAVGVIWLAVLSTSILLYRRYTDKKQTQYM